MSDNISSLVASFISFISENDKQIKHHPGGVLVSFAAPLQSNILKDSSLAAQLIKNSPRAFYFSNPEQNYTYLGIGECLAVNENGIGRFSLTDKKAMVWKEKFINNWEDAGNFQFPLFMGAMKFSAEHPVEIWKDYEDSSWFIPEVLLVQNNDKCFVVFNLIAHKGIDKVQLTEKYNKIYRQVTSVPDAKQTSAPLLRDEITNSQKEKKKWKQLVSNALEDILDRKINKIVYSRQAEYLLSGEPDICKIIEFFGQRYTSCYTFVYRRGKSVFFGATPERLARFNNNSLEIDSLAGSAPRGKTIDDDEKAASELLKNNKNLTEHNFVTEHIQNIIRKFSEDIKVSPLSIKKLPNIQHLWTKITASLNKNTGMFSILNELFPTPAVCGEPRNKALELIKKNESHSRGLYAGFSGWFNLNNEGEFVVSIRSAIAKSNKLYAFAGSGIVADSDPDEEFKETELKLNPILSIFQDENKNK